MNNEQGPMNNGAKNLYSLISFEDFKAILGLDDREDCLNFAAVRNSGYEFSHGENSTYLFQPPSLAAFCLSTATYTIEQYCKRRLILKKHFERIEANGDLLLPLREYPVREVLAVYASNNEQVTDNNEKLLEPELCRVIPDLSGESEGLPEDTVYSLSLSPAVNRVIVRSGEMWVKVRYVAGYVPGKAPPDLASACLELAAWNMSRYRGRRIGVTGAARGKGGEYPEMSMPENVKQLLEPYRRRTI
jgi:hypothetical protein